jgi:hypothetical protein
MHIIITIESMTIVPSISSFHPKLIPMFFHIDSIKEFKNYVQKWNFTSIVNYFTSVKGGKKQQG